jgi:hypothetical protein
MFTYVVLKHLEISPVLAVATPGLSKGVVTGAALGAATSAVNDVVAMPVLDAATAVVEDAAATPVLDVATAVVEDAAAMPVLDVATAAAEDAGATPGLDGATAAAEDAAATPVLDVATAAAEDVAAMPVLDVLLLALTTGRLAKEARAVVVFPAGPGWVAGVWLSELEALEALNSSATGGLGVTLPALMWSGPSPAGHQRHNTSMGRIVLGACLGAGN